MTNTVNGPFFEILGPETLLFSFQCLIKFPQVLILIFRYCMSLRDWIIDIKQQWTPPRKFGDKK